MSTHLESSEPMKKLNVIWILTIVLLCLSAASCQDPESAAETLEADTVATENESIASQLVAVKQTIEPTAVLSGHADMTRDRAYKVQLAALQAEAAGADRLVGWKMGGTRITDPTASPDPSFAYILHSDSLASGAQVSAARYVNGDLLVEAEIAFIMGDDLEGTDHSPESVMAAVAEVAGAIELIDVRITPGEDGAVPTMNHMIAANLSHAGLILTDERLRLDAVDVVAESATVFVDGEAQATGGGNQIMGSSPIDALVWIANALPTQGRHLQAGDVVITGSLYDNPTIVAGHMARVEFDSFGSISVSMGE